MGLFHTTAREGLVFVSSISLTNNNHKHHRERHKSTARIVVSRLRLFEILRRTNIVEVACRQKGLIECEYPAHTLLTQAAVPFHRLPALRKLCWGRARARTMELRSWMLSIIVVVVDCVVHGTVNTRLTVDRVLAIW